MPNPKTIQLKDFNYIGDVKEVECQRVLKALKQTKDSYMQARQPMVLDWQAYYASYCTTTASKQSVLSSMGQYIGKVNTSWRHNLKSPKAYEIVETLVTYFLGAFFPNERYFDLILAEPNSDPEYYELTEVNRLFVKNKLDESYFRLAYEIFIREICITGSSCLMFPWVGNNVKWQVLSALEFLLEPTAQFPNEANLIRYYRITPVEADFYRQTGVFDLVEKEDVAKARGNNYAFDLDIQNIQYMLGLNPDRNEKPEEHIVYEFWGDLALDDCLLKNVRISWTDDFLLNCGPNPYGFRPFQVGTYLRLSQSPWGIGALQPVNSQLYYKDNVTSRQADNVACGADNVFLVEQDGVVDPDDVYIAPGHKIFVTRKDAVTPLALNTNLGPTLTELAGVDQTCDKAIGTGPYIGVNAGRQGERVTAEEVKAQRDVGGKRLTTVFSTMEAEAFIPTLEKFHYFCRKFYKGQDLININGVYIRVTERTVDFPYRVKALGAANVADKEYNLRQFLDWLSVVSQNPELSARVDWDIVAVQLASQMVPFIDGLTQAVPQQQPQAGPPATGGEAAVAGLNDAANFVGGEAGQRALQSSLQAGNLDAQMQQMLMAQGGQNGRS